MDMYPIEDLGLVKIDILSNRSLGVYKDAVAAVRNAAARPGAVSLSDVA